MHAMSRAASRVVLLAAALSVLALIALPSSAVAGGTGMTRPIIDDGSAQRRIKAAYLFRFAHYVTWPPEAFARPDSPLVLGVAGDEALRAELQRVVAGKTVHGRVVQVRSVAAADPGAELHVLYGGALSAGARASLQRALAGRPVLVVSDLTHAKALNSMVSFVPVDDRVRFDVDLAPLTAGGLKVSALMLSAARRVERQP
jgi:hypothetical protein